VILGKLIGIPGIRVVTPADASEAGPLLREALRLAREHNETVIFLEPIMEMNSSIGHLQDADAHLPLGEAKVRQEGADFLVLTYGNNVPLVEKAQTEWQKKGISATIVNLPSLGTQTDWKTVVPYIEKHGKVLIVETERGQGSAGANLSAQIGEHFFALLDAAPVRVSARNVRTPAGKKNEAYALPQVEDIVREGLELAAY
jgi:pyruvate/2-oxoglutarate/acetoin dehydrogenase E1 component